VRVRREEEVPTERRPRSADRSLALAVALPPRCFARLFTGGGASVIMTPAEPEFMMTLTLKTGTGTAMVVTPQGPLRTQGSSLGTNIIEKCVLRTRESLR
jgi:hypothetical protein